MKIRIRFEKYGVMKFIGHLDVMRYFQKAMRRANIDIAFTEGYSPHMIMSFAQPLGVGITSSGEYVDIEINQTISSTEAVRRLNSVMVEGMHVRSFRKIDDGKMSKAMSLVAAADYTISFRKEQCPPKGWEQSFEDFLSQKEILVLKKTKKSEKEEDIRPMIYSHSVKENEISVRLAAGSAANLNPVLMMEAFASFLGWEMPEFTLLIHRDDILANGGNAGTFVSLEDLGEEIES